MTKIITATHQKLGFTATTLKIENVNSPLQNVCLSGSNLAECTLHLHTQHFECTLQLHTRPCRVHFTVSHLTLPSALYSCISNLVRCTLQLHIQPVECTL